MLIEAIVAIITALMTVILTLAGVIKFYLPRHDKVIHNPVALEDIIQKLEGFHTGMVEHSTESKLRLQETSDTLKRIEGTLIRIEGKIG